MVVSVNCQIVCTCCAAPTSANATCATCSCIYVFRVNETQAALMQMSAISTRSSLAAVASLLTSKSSSHLVSLAPASRLSQTSRVAPSPRSTSLVLSRVWKSACRTAHWLATLWWICQHVCTMERTTMLIQACWHSRLRRVARSAKR